MSRAKVGRVLTISVIAVSSALLVFLVPLAQLNATVGKSQFHKDRLLEVDAYNFGYDDLLPTLLNEEASGNLLDSPVNVSRIHDDIVSAARKTLPPEWLQEQTELAIDTLLPYLLGDTDAFTYTVLLRDRVEAAGQLIRDDIIATDRFTLVYDEAIAFLAEEAEKKLDQLPWAPNISRDQIAELLSVLLSEDWMRLKVNEALDTVAPYAKGDTDGFTIRVTAWEVAYQAAARIVDIITSEEALDYLLGELIGPIIEDNIGPIVEVVSGVTLTLEEIVSAIEKALPESWMRERLEEIAESAAAYLEGEIDSIEVSVDLGEWKAAILGILTGSTDELIQEYFDSLPGYSVAEFLQDAESLPPDTLPDRRPSGLSYREALDILDFDTARLIEERIGDRIPDRFAFTDADLEHPLGAILAAIGIGLFSDEDTYDYLLDELIAPVTEESIGGDVDLPFGVSLTLEEIISAIKGVLSGPWIQEQLEGIVNSIVAYLQGEADGAELTIDLGDWEAPTINVLTDLADDLLEELYYGLPEYSLAEFLQDVQGLPPDTPPDHRPSGTSYQEAMDILDIDIEALIEEAITDLTPDESTLDDVTRLVGETVDAFLAEVREWTRFGWTYTEVNLKNKLGSEGEQTLEEIRGWIRDGFTVTEADLIEAIGDEGVLETLDTASSWAKTARTWRWALLFVPLVLLALVVLLARHEQRRRRLLWTLSVMFLATLVAFIVTVAFLSTIGQSAIEDTKVDPSEFQGSALVLAEKENELIDSLSNGIVSAPKNESRYLLIVSGVGLAGLIGWGVTRRRRGRRT